VVIVSTCGSDFTTGLAAYEGSCGTFTGEACGNFDSGFCADREVISFVGQKGVTYHLRAGGYNNLGSGTLNILASQRWDNDDCAFAVPLTNGIAYVMNTSEATDAGEGGGCGAGIEKA